MRQTLRRIGLFGARLHDSALALFGVLFIVWMIDWNLLNFS